MKTPPPATPPQSPTIQPQKSTQETPVFKPPEEPKKPKNKLVPLLAFLLIATLGVAGYFGWENYKYKLVGNKNENREALEESPALSSSVYSGKNTVLSICSDLSKGECDKLLNYQLEGWKITKAYRGPEYEDWPTDTINLLMPYVFFNIEYTITVNKEDKKIISRLPEPSIFENFIKQTLKDDKLNALLEGSKLVTPNHTLIRDKDDYFEFQASFFTSPGCSKIYFIKFSELGEILESDETKPWCPGPL